MYNSVYRYTGLESYLRKKNIHKQKIQVLLKLIIELQGTAEITFKAVSQTIAYQ